MNMHSFIAPQLNRPSNINELMLSTAGLSIDDFSRFRAVWFEDGLIFVRTRTGGGNRECYSEDEDHSQCCHFYNEMLAEKPNFISDEDDDYDSTYALFKFEPLPEYSDIVKQHSEKQLSLEESMNLVLKNLGVPNERD